MKDPEKLERRIPTQERSREKYELILNTAKRLIGTHGNDAVSMREIAKESGVAISSIYQYFPDKNAILAAIMQGYFSRIRAMITAFVEDCEDLQTFTEGLAQGIDVFYQLFRDEPVLATIWAGVQANTQLRDLDAQDSQTNANILADRLCEIRPDLERNEIYDATLLLLHAAGMTARLALGMTDEAGKRLVEEYKKLALLRMQAIAH